MRQLLKEAKLIDSIKSLAATIETNDGVLLMDSIYKHLLPLATTCILEVPFACKRIENLSIILFPVWKIFLVVDKLRYKLVEDLKLAFCQRGILQGAYHKRKSLF